MKKRRKKRNDPHAAREARRYSDPIASREFILEQMHEIGAPASLEELAAALTISGEDALHALDRRLGAMVRDGQLLRNRRHHYCVVNRRDLIAGRVLGHPDGFGFLQPDEGGDDLFLSPRQMRALMPEDRVLVRVAGVDRRGRREGAVVEILERNTHRVVGRFHKENGVAFVTPDNKRIARDILVPPGSGGVRAKNGQIVVIELIEQPSQRSQALGRVIEVLGEHMAPGLEIDVAIRSYDLPSEWPKEVAAESKRFKPRVPPSAWKGRVDLRDLPLVTIDGADARDFDDAVYCEPKPKGWRVLVAIADVSNYVKPGNPLDREGRKRGNSVYFPERVIPMLPEVLSNGLCSLNPKEDRLCMVCDMYINQEGRITRSRFLDAVMHSKARLTYDEAAEIMVERKTRTRKRFEHVAEHLDDLYKVFRVLHKARAQRGAIDFETNETRIVFGEDRKIEKIEPLVRNDAHKVIEECMIAANVCAARYLERNKMPALYRIHDGPGEEKLTELREFLGELALGLGGGSKPEPKHYGELLRSVRGRPDEHLIQTVLLRSLSQAVYSPDNHGHFGLAHEAYAHFTSPIRRYPDLMVHRAIRHCLAGGKPDNFEFSHQEMVSLGEQCSVTERRADEATRDVVDWLKCEFIMEHIGEEFEGTITGVSSFGLFVELDEVFVTGLAHITTLGRDYFNFDPIGHHLTGERSGVVFRLADRMKVKVVRVDLDDRKVDLEPVDKINDGEEGERKPRRKRKGRKRKGGARKEGERKEGERKEGERKEGERKDTDRKKTGRKKTGRKGGKRRKR